MTIHLVTFSDDSMSRARDLCIKSAQWHGVQSANSYRPASVIDFCERPELIRERGLGHWRWKPRVIADVMRSCVDGDILIYADAGVEFINNVNHIIDRMNACYHCGAPVSADHDGKTRWCTSSNGGAQGCGHVEQPHTQDVFLFGNNWEHYAWCKRDVIEAVWPNRLETQGGEAGGHFNLWRHFSKQCQASVIFFRVSDYTRKFVAEWLKWCLFEGGRLIDDSPSRAPNHPEFREHRHDQAILTTLAYREGLRLHWWPAVYNKGGSPEFVYEKLPEYAGDDYPAPLFHHHRKRDSEWQKVA